MKINIQRDELNKALQTVSKALPGKALMPILSGILIETTTNGIKLTASDLDFSAQQTISAEIIEPGSVVADGKDIASIVSKLPTGMVEFTADDRIATVKSKKTKFELPTMPAKDYPEVAKPEGDSFTVKSDDLKQAIKQTIFATIPDDARPFVSSVLFEITTDKLRLVATDVNRMVVRDIRIHGDATGSVLVPVKALREIGNVITGDVTVYINRGQIFIVCDGLTMGVRLIDAQFPKYEQIVSVTTDGAFTVNRNEFIKSLERAMLVNNTVRLEIDDSLKISTKEPNKGQFSEELPAKRQGEPLTIGFNAKFWLDFLKAVDTETVEIGYINPQKPAIARLDNYQYIVMPIRLEA